MSDCSLDQIRMIYNYFEAYAVNVDGTKGELILTGAPRRAYPSRFLEYYCVPHNCSFKQWRDVLTHLGEAPIQQ